MVIGAVALLAAMVFAFTNFLKYLRSGDKNGVITTLTVWVAGISGVFLLGATNFANLIPFTVQGKTFTLDYLNSFSKVVLGILVGSGAVAFDQYKKARDNTDSASTPSLVPPTPVDPPVVDPPAPVIAQEIIPTEAIPAPKRPRKKVAPKTV